MGSASRLAACLHRGEATLPRVTGVEIVRLLAESSERTGARIFLLGADPGVAPKAAARLQKIVARSAIRRLVVGRNSATN